MIPNRLFALVDCNNFYCSCERVFNPKLMGCPVIVLSNNDGCVVARSEETKRLGIERGTPFSRIQHLVGRLGLQVFSSNYSLYGDMSRRVMETLSEFVPNLEIYSIDEAFLALDGFSGRDLDAYGRLIRSTVFQRTGLPVSIGIAATKTLAKVANKRAKKMNGVLDLSDPDSVDAALDGLACHDIWGIGTRLANRLKNIGICTALELKRMDPRQARQIMGVVGERIVRELNGISCLSLEELRQPRKSIVCSRSFGQPVSEISELEEALCSHTTRAAEKLRGQGSTASSLMVFLSTNPFRQQDRQYGNQGVIRLDEPTDFTPDLLKAATVLLERLYREGFLYKRIGVVLLGIAAKSMVQRTLFTDVQREQKQQRLIRAVDGINQEWGRDTVRFGGLPAGPNWEMRSARKSPGYTTRWEDLPKVIA